LQKLCKDSAIQAHYKNTTDKKYIIRLNLLSETFFLISNHQKPIYTALIRGINLRITNSSKDTIPPETISKDWFYKEFCTFSAQTICRCAK